ncbi:MAG TPA: cytochrome c [Bacteroidia bacterium]|nr:cytochrome c [Bacteroidia bacterium]
MNDDAFKGKMLYQKFNCTACHQLYGLGGYLGPELTSAYSQKAQNDAYFSAILKNGTVRMPDFNLSDKEVNQVIEYLKYIDQTSKHISAY